MQKHVHLVDLVKSFPTNIFLQNLASIQRRTSPIQFAHLAEKSEKGSISNLSTKLAAVREAAAEDLVRAVALVRESPALQVQILGVDAEIRFQTPMFFSNFYSNFWLTFGKR